MKKIDIKIFCNELINFDKYIEDPWDIIDLAIAKSLYLKDVKKIPKKFQHQNYSSSHQSLYLHFRNLKYQH